MEWNGKEVTRNLETTDGHMEGPRKEFVRKKMRKNWEWNGQKLLRGLDEVYGRNWE